jgi:hypothetical protein
MSSRREGCDPEVNMKDDVAGFIGSIPQHYDQSLGPLIFTDYAADLARRVAAGNPARVLETAAGTGILTRHLRGGRYLFNVWDSHRHNPFGRIAHEVIGRFFPGDPPQFQSVPFSYRFEAAKDSLIDAGFADVNAVVLRLEKDVPDPAILARGLVCGSPIIDQVRARGGVEPEQIVAAIVQEYRREFGTGRWRMPLQATVISATKPASP